MVTVPQAGWAGIQNGELLRRAQEQFDVFVTVDRNLSFQQYLPQFNIPSLFPGAYHSFERPASLDTGIQSNAVGSCKGAGDIGESSID